MPHSMLLLLFLWSRCLFMWRGREKSVLLMDVFCVFFFYSLLRLRRVSVVFDFSPSLNDVAPVSPMLLPVVVNSKGKIVNCWWTSFVRLLLSLLLRSSAVSVVFDFNDSLNNVAPLSPMSMSVDSLWWQKGVIVCLSLLCCHRADKALWLLCLTSILHWMQWILL